MVGNYWKAHHRRARQEAFAALWDQSKERTVIAILVWALAMFLVWTFGDRADVKSEIILSIGFTAALGLMFPGVYAWKFISLFPRRYQEALAEHPQPDGDKELRERELAAQIEQTRATREHTAAMERQRQDAQLDRIRTTFRLR